MKSIFLVRHAKAEDQKDGIPDCSRSLVKQGIKEAVEMAKKMDNKVSGKMIFISSPASRALETAHIFAEKLNYPVAKILIKDEVYKGSAENIIDIVKKTKDSYNTIILFGHNPVLSELASIMIKGFEFDIPKSGILAFKFSKNSWIKIEQHAVFLKWLRYPSQRSEKIYEFQEILNKKISKAIFELFNCINPEISKSLQIQIDGHADKLSKNFIKNLRRMRHEKLLNK